MGRRRLAVGDPHRPRRRDPHEVRDHVRGDPQPHAGAQHPRHDRLPGQGVPHRALGLRVHRGQPDGPRVGEPCRQDGGPRGHGGIRHPVRPATRTLFEAPLCVPANAVGDRLAGEPPDDTGVRGEPVPRLAEGADGQLLGGDDRQAGRRRHGERRLDALHGPGRQLHRRAGDVTRGGGARRRGVRLRGDGGTPPPDRGDGPRSGGRRGTEAVLPVRVQAPALPRRVPRDVQRAQRHTRRLPGGDRARHRSRARRQRPGVRGRLHRVRPPASRPR